jgi:hypothetical protein
MCPACITTVALLAGGAASTGGLTALVARVLSRKRKPAGAVSQTNPSSREGLALTQRYPPGGDEK